MKIPFLDLRAQYNSINEEVQASIQDVFNDTAFASGPYVEKFESNFSSFCNAKYCIAVNSGTSALHLALLAHGISPGDEIITVPNSFIATTWAISYCGAKPIFVDVDPQTWLINTDLIEKAITPKTKAILPVHLYGQPANMIHVNEIAKKYNLTVIEDAAQAHAATYKGEKIGSLGNTTCFSFYPGKNLGAYGEGGAIVTDDKEMALKMQKLRNHGQSERYYHDLLGYNYRMDGLQGAILNVKLKYLAQWTNKRNEIALNYQKSLNIIDAIQTPYINEEVTSAFHLYVIHTDKREILNNYLNEKGISTGFHYPVPIHLQKPYLSLNHSKGDFPISEFNAEKCLSLPMYPELNEEQISYISNTIINYFN